MKHLRRPALILGAIIAGMWAYPAYAQRSPPAEVQRDYELFISRFRGALKANDGAAVTAMTKFPFYWGEMRDAAYFQKNLYSRIFTPKVRNCLARGKGVYARNPLGGDDYTLFCGEALFLFTRTPDGFRFIEEGVND